MPQVRVLETANNPGDALTIPLAGAPTSYRTWLAALGSGVRDTYTIEGGGLFEWGIGYPTAGAPNTFTREIIFGGSAGVGNRVNFTGQVDVFSDFLPERTAALDANGKILNAQLSEPAYIKLVLNGQVGVPGDATATTFNFDQLDWNTLFPGASVPRASCTIGAGQAGTYSIDAKCEFQPNGAGFRALRLNLNGLQNALDQQAGSGWGNFLAVSWLGYLAEGTTVACQVMQSSNAALNVGVSPGLTNLTIRRVRG